MSTPPPPAAACIWLAIAPRIEAAHLDACLACLIQQVIQAAQRGLVVAAGGGLGWEGQLCAQVSGSTITRQGGAANRALASARHTAVGTAL